MKKVNEAIADSFEAATARAQTGSAGDLSHTTLFDKGDVSADASAESAGAPTVDSTWAHAQKERDQPFQKALGASLQAADKARAERVRRSQEQQQDRK